ncbi:LOW QUALITY PROTEIN: hypothetical protein Cgig2_001126 [Carnegiea gigantea]|uniref:Uncharacterized protein n=1 Tax=Carnegiea gigantea TaxID=171969 RepID=A0A9Q1Q5X1_9CARY|nr:LOW QUALITY PROTEIN: hypothetical protein Cgig2_001126 [Carnegiea gigantea]
MTMERGTSMRVPPMTSNKANNRGLLTPHDDPCIVELKIISALVQRILIAIGILLDIIMRECLKQLKYLVSDVTSLVNLIIGFRGHGKEPRSGLLVVRLPTVNNVIIGWLTLYKINMLYLLQVWYELDVRSVGKLCNDLVVAREYYLVNTKLSVELKECPKAAPPVIKAMKPWLLSH